MTNHRPHAAAPHTTWLPIVWLLTAAALGCNRSASEQTAPATTASAPSATASTTASSSQAAPEPYQGPTGTLTGTITVTGDPPPSTSFSYAKECEPAAATYGKLFRVGQDGTLADALVAVTKYQGYVPAKSQAVEVTIRACAYSTRTIALTDGQHIEVRNLDPLTAYIPHLDGARQPALLTAVPRGPVVPLRTRGYGRYWLRDEMGRDFMVANVFHFRYSTFAVTGLDGRYRIESIPVGQVEVSAMLPQAELLSTTKPFEVKPGDNQLDLELRFDAAKHTPKPPAPKVDGGAR